jgi:Methylmalonic aciduria and homocystinuria type D protein
LCLQFLEFGEELCGKLRRLGYWADYIDPCSGLPMLTRDCNKVYSEVDGMECLLNYKAYNAGFCKVLTHPRWGSAVYPATIFCYAPRDVVSAVLRESYIIA